MEIELNLTELQPFKLLAFLHCRLWSLCNQFLLQFSMNVSETLQTYYGHTEDVHVGFGLS